ncbi:metal-dependent hydrolase [Alkalihalobacillus sp. CinArs1]|uniref:metal-dependent hydrolase n=1 Tax=Alkalihalobacillus sp. CinArs1 TaxID=2995314 RepID=UPI0022DE7E6A|nr:metal-dependent hydrolase [Alkalihalobacillus sp. CinArs1]
MEGKTHLMGGLCMGAAAHSYYITEVLPVPELIVFYGSCLFGALLPDICHPGSWTGRKAKVLSKNISRFFGHRTITHSLLFLILVYWLTSTFTFMYYETVQIGLLVGIVSHIVLDALTVRGIQLFYPIPLRVRFPLYLKTASKGESVISSSLMLLTLFFVYKQMFS